MKDLKSRREEFRKLHEEGCFVIPNPWDVGSAKYLAGMGFKALASSSGGFAFSRGLPDLRSALPRELVLQHMREIVEATELPVNADFQDGFGASAEEVFESVRLCVETGVAGLSIEDATGGHDAPLYALEEAVDRISAARAAINESGEQVMLVGRAECYLVGHPNPYEESIKRLQAYAEAGADVLFAPGVREPAEIKGIVEAVAPRPVNVIVSTNTGVTVAELAALGVRRISVGSSLARAAWGAFIRAAKGIYEEGNFSGFDNLTPYADLQGFFSAHAERN